MAVVYYVQVPTTISDSVNQVANGLFDDKKYIGLPLERSFPVVESGDVVVLPRVFKVEAAYSDAVYLWQKYFETYAPGCTLVVVGWDKNTVNHSNYIDALQIPTQLDAINETWLPVNNMANYPLSQGGIDLKSKIFRFFEGHGDESVLDELDKMIRMLKIAVDEINIHQTPFQELWEGLLLPSKWLEKWENFLSRWSYYKGIFVSTPFYDVLQELDQAIDKIRPFCEAPTQQKLLDLDCLTHLQTIKTKLLHIETIYV